MDVNKNGTDDRQIFNFCHDFRTPLSTIMGMTTMTWAELGDREKVKERLTKIETASSYLLAMINELLDYSVIINGKMTIHSEVFSLNRIIDLLDQLHRSGFERKNQEYEIKYSNIFEEYLMGDFLRISQVLTNLLTNAMKYTGVGGKITLEFSQIPKSEDVLVLEMKVTDNGIGMSEDFINRMFEPYSVAGVKNSNGSQSTGLGLYITKNLVSMMDGEIEVTSVPREGTIFTVKIPCGIPSKNAAFDFGEKFILIAEDNPDLLAIMSELIESTGARVRSFQNGFLILDYFLNTEKDEVDAILLDLDMPVMSGLDVIRKIRDLCRPDSKNIPIIAVTGCDSTDELEEAYKAGASVIIKKPVDYEYLFNLLDNYFTPD